MNGVRECCEHEYESACDCCIGECENCAKENGYEISDVEADADTLASAGFGTDEDYGG
jgi:hypothetical protein